MNTTASAITNHAIGVFTAREEQLLSWFESLVVPSTATTLSPDDLKYQARVQLSCISDWKTVTALEHAVFQLYIQLYMLRMHQFSCVNNLPYDELLKHGISEGNEICDELGDPAENTRSSAFHRTILGLEMQQYFIDHQRCPRFTKLYERLQSLFQSVGRNFSC